MSPRASTPTPLRKLALIAAAVATAVGLAGGTTAVASSGHHEPGAPHKASQIPNLGIVKNEIKAYYGDRVKDGEHYASADSNYADEVRQVEARAERFIAQRLRHGVDDPAIVLDVDDTTLLTYNYELEEDFGYDPVTNNAYIQARKMHAVFGMPALVKAVEAHGVTVFYVTGRPETQRDATAGNLAEVGYGKASVISAHLYLKPASGEPFPDYVDCTLDGDPACSTIEYKSETRDYIESLGYQIIADMGDQYSDLKGGDSGRTFKMPNPMYYLP